MPRLRSLLLGGTLAILCGSCGPDGIFGRGDRVCTQAGCGGGLTVRLATQPTGPIKIEVFEGHPDANVAARVSDCAANCLKDVTFHGFTPDHPYIRITYGGMTKVTEVPSVTYTMSRPNGPDCPPECKQGTIDVPLPAATAAVGEHLGN